MRGIEFQIEGGYFDLLTQLVEDILLDKYIFFVAEDEIFRDKIGELKFPSRFCADYFAEIRNVSPYYVNFMNLQAYPIDAHWQPIKTYEDFFLSDCAIIILVVDGRYVEIYAKSDELILQFIKNAVKLKGVNITIKTDYDDGRTRMNVY